MNKSWKDRYFCLESDRLYYSKRPNKSSKGFIELNEATALCLLPHRPETEPIHRGHIPLVICTSDRIWMLAFDNQTVCDTFIDAIRSSPSRDAVPMRRVIIEDWAMVQYDSALRRRWIRQFLVYLGSGDLLVFADGSTTELVYRVRMIDIQKVAATFDGAAGNGMLSPRSRRERTVDQCLQVILKDRAISVEFDSTVQYEKWKLVLRY